MVTGLIFEAQHSVGPVFVMFMHRNASGFSRRHVGLHPSFANWFPSSHASPGSKNPLEHRES